MATTHRSARRGRRLAVATLATMAAFAVFPASGAHAATQDAAGWWSMTASPVPVNPTSAQVADGQLHVEGGPNGPTAIAALRWTLAEGESTPLLKVTPASSSVMPPGAVVVACAATSPWQEAQGGAWAEAPKFDCAAPANGVVAEDGSIDLDLSPLVKGTSLDVVLMPGTNEQGVSSTLSLTFDRPGPEALTTSTGTGSSSGTFDPTGPTTSSDPSTSYSDSSATSGTGTDTSYTAPSTGGTSFSAPSTGGVDFSAPAGDTAAPAAPSGQPAQAAASGQPAGNAAAANASSSSEGSSRAKNLGLVILMAGVAVLGWAWTATSPSAAAAKVKAAVTARPLLARRPVAQ